MMQVTTRFGFHRTTVDRTQTGGRDTAHQPNCPYLLGAGAACLRRDRDGQVHRSAAGRRQRYGAESSAVSE